MSYFELPYAEEMRNRVENRQQINEIKAKIIDILKSDELDTLCTNVDVLGYEEFSVEQVISWLKKHHYRVEFHKGDTGHDGPYAYIHIEW